MLIPDYPQTPMWRDVDNAVSESVEESTTRGDSLEPHSSDIEVVQKVTSATRLAQTTASLVRTEKGNIKLLDQNLETRRVVRDAIIDAKGYIIFVNAYPELVDKNQVSLQSLLTVAENRGIKAIKKRLQTDAQYAALLGSLVSRSHVSFYEFLLTIYLRSSPGSHYCGVI